MANKRGIDCKLYFNATPFSAAPSSLAGFTLAGNVQDVTANFEADRIEANSRANNGWKAYLAGLKDGGLETTLLWDTEDAFFAAVQAAWAAGTPIAIAALDAAHDAGGEGIAGNYVVLNFSRSEPLDGAVTANVQLAPHSYNAYFEGGGSA